MMEIESHDLAESLPRIIDIVRDEIIPIYSDMAGEQARVKAMRRDIEDAERAIANNDIVQMMILYEDLSDYMMSI